MRRIRMMWRELLAAGLVVLVSSTAQAQFGNPFRNTPLDPSTYPGAAKDVIKAVTPRVPEESVSGLAVVTPPGMDRDGNIYSGTSNSTGTNRRVGRGELKFNSKGEAFWVSNYSNSLGRVKSPVRALPKYDRVAEVSAQRERERQRSIAQQRERERQAAIAQQQEWQRRQAMAQQQEWERQQIERQREWEQQQARMAQERERQRAIAERQEWERQQALMAQPRPPQPVTDPGYVPNPTSMTRPRRLGVQLQRVDVGGGQIGLQITEVLAGEAAQRAGLERGDVIVRVDGQRVQTPAELIEALSRSNGQPDLRVLNVRDGQYLHLRVPIE